ncbi:radical SAM protein [Marinoscillum sp. MHG1-6]|uniref:radical SAM protein n=1 Tax=Marinoscillum sp. MHG1-6 TaxID=2959627 RepID=UPI0021574BDE|nr:radical SAM protein [Marinoscillum sp. MHG1-6]
MLNKVKNKYQRIFGERFLSKAARVGNRYFWRLAAPGFPSLANYRMHQNEINRFVPTAHSNGMRSVLFAITKKCPLSCEHCFEWNNLSKSETLSVDEIIAIIHKYQDYGTTQMMLSGGEPMVRINDVYKILDKAKEGTDFWIITSGIGLHDEQATRLKAKGLTGVMISLDHYEEAGHDKFRGFGGSFQAAIQAVKSANKAGLVVTLALCSTREFTTSANLISYMDLAKDLGVAFVQLIEPRATGRYESMDVALGKEHISLLEDFYYRYNTEKAFRQYPIINYLGYHQRRVGCFGAGDRFFYIDTDGDAHICPYCVKKVSNTINETAIQTVESLSQHSCHEYV